MQQDLCLCLCLCLFEVHLLSKGISDGLNLHCPWAERGKIGAGGEDLTQGKGRHSGKRRRGGKAEKMGTKCQGAGMTERDPPGWWGRTTTHHLLQDQEGDMAAPQGAQSQSGTAKPGRHLPLKPSVPFLLPQLTVPGFREQRECHPWLHLSVALWEMSPCCPTKTNSEISRSGGYLQRNGKQRLLLVLEGDGRRAQAWPPLNLPISEVSICTLLSPGSLTPGGCRCCHSESGRCSQ